MLFVRLRKTGRMIHKIVLVVLLVFWAIVGLIFWIPLLARITAFYAFMVIASAYTDSNLATARSGIDSAVSFYPDGFKRITSSLLGPSNNEESVRPLASSELSKIFGVEVLSEAFARS